MTWEPSSVHHSETAPPRAAENLSLAERYATFAEFAASTASVPQTAATALDVARFHAFTGEMTFSIDPAVRLYLDGGAIYHAERDGDPSLGRLILDAGVIDSVQLQRGVVGVGGTEHFGRLFDRDATVDRDAVMVVVESATDAIVQQLANSVIAAVSVLAYRHHPSGIHRWFVAPHQPTGTQRPASGVMQVDRSVVEELAPLGAPAAPVQEPRRTTEPAAVEMRIEWAEPDPSSMGLTERLDDPSARARSVGADLDIQAEFDRFDADRADWAAAGGEAPDAFESMASPLGEFRILWPDGTRDDSIVGAHTAVPEQPLPAAARPGAEPNPTSPSLPAPPVTLADPVADDPVADDPVAVVPIADDPVGVVRVAAPIAPPIPVEAPPLPPADRTDAPGAPGVPAPTGMHSPHSLPSPGPGPLGLTIEPLQIDRIPEPDAAVPDDVAAVVRRALRAIETAADHASHTAAAELPLAPVVLPDLTLTSPTTTPNQATPNQATPNQATPNQATPNQATPNQATPNQATPAPVDIESVSPPSPASEPSSEDPADRIAPGEPLGFAPPTSDMRAEEVHERVATQAGSSTGTEPTAGEFCSSHPEPGKASIVFVDDEDDSQEDRRSALRRLIGSLRNKA